MTLLLALLLVLSLVGCRPSRSGDGGEGDDAPAFTAADALSYVLAVTCRYYGEDGSLYATSGGSGVIYRLDEDGGAYVLTNYHVVHDALRPKEDAVCQALSVAPYGLEESEGLDATCLGTVGDFDFAVLYVARLTELFPSARAISLSRAPVIGEQVLAVGNALARGISVTQGIVSRESEELSLLVPYRSTSISLRLLRHDAAVNEGNSGGALFGADGAFLGLVNARLSGEDAVGVNYAIPAASLLPLAEDVIRTGKADRWQLGVLTEDKTRYTEISDGAVTVKTELYVSYVDAGSPASTFLRTGDVLLDVTLNGKTVALTEGFVLSELCLSVLAEDTLVFRYLRGGKEQSFTIKTSPLQFVTLP